ncbi:MAG: EpsG family protein [Desulfitobacteriaceae bacterium]
MTIYFILIFLIGLSSIVTRKIKNRSKVVTAFSCLCIFLIQAVRGFTVGTDIHTYLLAYQNSKNLNFFKGDILLDFELGYSLYTQFFSRIGFSEQQYLALTAIVIIVPIGLIVYRNSKMPEMSMFLYIVLGFFTFAFSGLRQSIAIALVFFSFEYIKKEKYFKFLACIVLATLFHTSAIVCVILYPLYKLKIRKHHLLFIIPTFIVMFSLKGYIAKFIIETFFGMYVQFLEKNSAIQMFFAMMCMYILATVFTKDSYTEGKEEEFKQINSYKNYLLVALFIQLFGGESRVITRVGYYFFLYTILLVPEVIVAQKDKITRMIMIVAVVVLGAIFYYTETAGGTLSVVPYKFFWE